MEIKHDRSAGDYIKRGQLLADYSALKSCVDGKHARLLAEERLVALCVLLAQRRDLSVLPAGIGIDDSMLHFKHLGVRLELLKRRVGMRRLRRSCKEGKLYLAVRLGLNYTEVSRELNEPCDIVVHFKNSVLHGCKQEEYLLLRVGIHYLLCRLALRKSDREAIVVVAKLCANYIRHFLNCRAEALGIRGAYLCNSLARNSVVLASAADRYEREIHVARDGEQYSAEQLICVCSALVYVLTRMSACKTADRKSKRFCARGSGYICRGEAERASDTARTACDYLGLVSAVHIYHSRSAHAAVVKARRALKSDLLGNSKEALDRRMRGEIALRAVKYIKHSRNCHAVVSAKGSSVCSEPAVLL